MAAIHGDLTVVSLANLVQLLVQDRSVGLLTIESGGDRRTLRVSPGGIRLIRGSQRCHRLERVLRRLVGMDSLPSDDFGHRIGRLVREWMLEEICELFTWLRGSFTFEKAEAGTVLEDGPFGRYAADCDVTTVSIEATRWSDELPRIRSVIRDLRQVPEHVDVPGPLLEPPCGIEACDDVLRLIDGTRSVLQILQLSLFPRFVVLQVLYGLCRQSAIRMKEPTVPAAAALARAA
jgi:hypothetical protein